MDNIEKNNDKTEEEQGLGDFLRSVREKKGLTLEDMARTIRVRRHFIDALEDEDWENLPSPVFVKGFIRSYAKALDLDLSKVLALYEKIGPKKEELPHPLITPEKPKKNLILFFILLIGVAIILTYLWISYPKVAEIAPETPITMKSEEKVPEEKTVSTDRNKQTVEQEDDLSIDEEETNTQEEEALTDTVDSSMEGDDKGVPNDVQKEDLNVEPEGSSIEEEEIESATDNSSITEPEISNHEEPETPTGAEVFDERSVISEPEPEEVLPVSENDQSTPPLTLTGIVSMRTYVKIYIDDNLPKEYIFKPGSKPQWEAKEGFNIIIGNAAGIIFNFNGNLIKDLGRPGKVVSLSLPEDFKSKLYKE